jgi:lactate permease
MYALIALLPILFVVLLMAIANVVAKKALMIGWIAAALIALMIWRMDGYYVLAYSLYGAMSSIDVIIIIFGAILLMNTLKRSGAMSTINRGFSQISADPRIQAVIIGFLFGSFIEGGCRFWNAGCTCRAFTYKYWFSTISCCYDRTYL